MIKVFASCAFPVSDFTKHCIELGKAINMELITLDNHETGDIHEKIKCNMHCCQGILFVLEEKTESDGQIHNFSSWMSEERTIADGLNLPMGIVNNSNFSIPNVFPSTLEHLDKKDITEVTLIATLNSLKSKIEEALQPEKPSSITSAYIRKFIKHKVTMKKDGAVRYTTSAEIESLRNGLKDVRHSIYTQYSPCWDATHRGAIPQIDARCNQEGGVSIIESYRDEKKYTWSFQFSKALKKQETLKYGFTVDFPEYFPATKEKLKDMSKSPDYPYINDRIEHHFFINNQTLSFEMELFFEDSSVAQNFNVTVYNGRLYSQDCVDQEEVERIRRCLTIDNESLFGETVKLIVSNPKVGSTYSISWELGG